MTIENKVEAIASAFEEFKKLNDKAINELKTKGSESSETKQQVERANAEIDRLSKELKAAQTAMNRGGTASNDQGNQDQESKARKAAFIKFARHGKESMSAEEVKALSTGSDPDGGYLVTPEMSSEIVKKVFESSPMRQLASVVTIASNQFEIIEDLGEFDAAWVGETGARAESNTSELKKLILPVHEIFAKPKATQQMLDDAGLNVEAWIAEKVSDKFARSEATAFISGNGIGKPRGILNYASGTTGWNDLQQVVSGSSGAFTADGLMDLVYSLKAPYKANAKFLMKRASVAAVRKLKDSQNQYLWAPGIEAGQPDMLLGFGIVEADDMETIAANSLSAAFGDFKAGYQIVDRIGIRTLRDPYSSKPYVEFYTTKRVGGGVKNFEAIKIQKLGT
jgi:HK97 family phage major capsid protein